MSKFRPGPWRKDWQAFKKKHPDFGKGKNFKADLGPMLDAVEKHDAVLGKLLAQADKEIAFLAKLSPQIEDVVMLYAKAATGPAKADFMKIADEIVASTQGVPQMVKAWKEFADIFE